MFTIQYETIGGTHAFEKFESESWQLLLNRIANFEHPVAAVYEGDVPITKAIRSSLVQTVRRGDVQLTTPAAKVFAMEGQRL